MAPWKTTFLYQEGLSTSMIVGRVSSAKPIEEMDCCATLVGREQCVGQLDPKSFPKALLSALWPIEDLVHLLHAVLLAGELAKQCKT